MPDATNPSPPPSSAVAAAPVPVVLGGQTWLLSPFRDREIVTLENWMRSEALAIAKENLGGLNPEDRASLLRAAYQEAMELSFTSPKGMRYLTTWNGATMMSWLSLRQNHPELTLEKLREMMAAEQASIDRVMDRIDEVNSVPGGQEEEGDVGPKKKDSLTATGSTAP